MFPDGYLSSSQRAQENSIRIHVDKIKFRCCAERVGSGVLSGMKLLGKRLRDPAPRQLFVSKTRGAETAPAAVLRGDNPGVLIANRSIENTCKSGVFLLCVSPLMYPPVDTSDPKAVQAEVGSIYRRLFREETPNSVDQAFEWALMCFGGRYPGYLAIDALYHDVEHTMQGTLCLARLLEGRDQSGVLPRIDQEVFDLSFE